MIEVILQSCKNYTNVELSNPYVCQRFGNLPHSFYLLIRIIAIFWRGFLCFLLYFRITSIRTWRHALETWHEYFWKVVIMFIVNACCWKKTTFCFASGIMCFLYRVAAFFFHVFNVLFSSCWTPVSIISIGFEEVSWLYLLWICLVPYSVTPDQLKSSDSWCALVLHNVYHPSEGVPLVIN